MGLSGETKADERVGCLLAFPPSLVLISCYTHSGDEDGDVLRSGGGGRGGGECGGGGG